MFNLIKFKRLSHSQNISLSSVALKYFSVKSNLSLKSSTNSQEEKCELVSRLLSIKEKKGFTFDHIANQLGVTNAYCAQLFYNQAQLKPQTSKKLKELLPDISEADLQEMQKAPNRSYSPNILQEPHIYRMNEAVLHYGESLKAVVNEKFGDGIMSAIDFYVTVDKVKGVHGEDRVVLTFNGKFLPHVEQLVENDTSKKRL